MNNELHDKNGILLILDIEIQSEHYVIIKCYGNNDQQGYLETLSVSGSLLDKINFKLDTNIILGGDFNVISDTFRDADGGSLSLKTNSLNTFSTLLSDHDLCDIFRIRFPDIQRFSWRQKNTLIQRRLDYFFISNEIQEDVAFIDIVSSVASDYFVVHLKISGAKIKDNQSSDILQHSQNRPTGDRWLKL